MSTLPPNIAQNSAVWAILEPVLDTPLGARDRAGNEITAPSEERKVAAQRLLQYLVDQRILFATAELVIKAKEYRYSRDDLQVALSMCAVRIANFVQYSLTRDKITADIINDTVRPTIGLLTQVALVGAGHDIDREYRDQLTGTSTLWRRHRYAMQWQEELRQKLMREPSIIELNEYFAECSSQVTSQTVKRSMLVTTDDLTIPPQAGSLDVATISDAPEGMSDTIADVIAADDPQDAEARLDAAVAIGMIHRAIRMWAPGDADARAKMHRYVSAWITIRCEPNAPLTVSVHEAVKLSGLSNRVAARMAVAFDEHILPYVRENMEPAQAQAHVQRLSLVDTIEGAIQGWAPGDSDRQGQMREFTSAWFRAHRFQYKTTVPALARALSWPWPQTREVMSQFESVILPVIDKARQEREEVAI